MKCLTGNNNSTYNTDPKMSYRFIATDFVVGDSSVPGYTFTPQSTGFLQLEQVGDASALVDVDGNVVATGLKLTNVGAERVFISGANGDVITSSFPGQSAGNASYLATGKVDTERIAGEYLNVGNITVTGTLSATDLGGNVNANLVTSGIVDDARLNGSYAFNGLVAQDVVAHTATGNINTLSVTEGLVHPDRVAGEYTFETLTLTGNATASFASAQQVNAESFVTGTLSNDRLVGAYTVDGITTTLLETNVAVVSGQVEDRCLVSEGPVVVSSVTTSTDVDSLRGMIGNSVQVQLDEIRDGLVVGNAIQNLDATQFKSGVLSDQRLNGSYTFRGLTLSDNLSAPIMMGNLVASSHLTGTIDPARIAGTYDHITSLSATGTLAAASVSANLSALDLVSGHIDDARLVGQYAFNSLTTTSNVTAAWCLGNVHANDLTGTIPQDRFNFDPVPTSILSPGSFLGTPNQSWGQAYASTATVDDVTVGSSVRAAGGAYFQLDLHATDTSIIPTVPVAYTLGTTSKPWESLHATDITVGGLIVGDGIVDPLGNALALFDLENVPVTMLPKIPGLSIGTETKPWTVRASSLQMIDEVGVGQVDTGLFPQTVASTLGAPDQPWANVYSGNVTGQIDGEYVGDLWAQLDTVSGTIEATDGIYLPDGVAAFRFEETLTGLGLRDGSLVGGMDLSIDGTPVTTVVPGTLTQMGPISPSANAVYALGAPGLAWSNLVASHVSTPVGNLGTNDPITVVDIHASGTVSSTNLAAQGTVSAPLLTGNLDATSLTGTVISDRFGAGTYSVSNLDVVGNLITTGTLTCGNLTPITTTTADLGSPSSRFRDLYVSSNSIHLGAAILAETDGAVTISSNVIVTNGVSGAGVGAPLIISNVQVTDSEWVPLDDTAVALSGGYVRINGSGFAPSSIVKIGDTNAVATSYVSSTQLRVQAPAKSSGTYNVTLVRPDTKTATFPSALTYSDVVTWITSTSLGNADWGTPSTISIQAESDSNVTYSNITSIPGTLNSSTGLLSFTLPRYEYSTYSFDISATDEQYQDAVRTFLLTSRSDILTKMQASRDTANIHTTGLVTSVPNSTHTGANSYPYGKPVVLPSGNVLIPPGEYAGAKVYNPTNNTISVPAQIPGSPTGYRHSCALHDGRVMLFKAGGYKAAIYTESSDSWTFTTPNLEPGVQLYDGRIFSRPTGGFYKLYDIGTDSVVQYATSLNCNSMILLDNGNVFGGVNYSTVWTYNPYTNSFTDITSAFQSFASRGCHARCLLPDGRVFSNVYDCNAGQGAIIYDPADGTVMQTPSFPGSGTAAFFDCCILPDGRVLVPRYISGVNHAIYNPVTNTVQSMYAPNIEQRSQYVCATKNGKALITPLDNQAGSVYIFTPDSTVPDTWANDDPIHYHVASASTG